VEEGQRAVERQKLEWIQFHNGLNMDGDQGLAPELLLSTQNIRDNDQEYPRLYSKTYSDEWETFHRTHSAGRFFKEKRYLTLEFPCLLDKGDDESGLRVGEIGCGCGSALIPVLRENKRVNAVGCDVSETATQVFREMCQKAGIENDRVELHVHAAGKSKSSPFQDDSCDRMMVIFTLSAMRPSEMTGALCEAKQALKKGGLLLIRDYGLYDMAQLRFPGSQLIDHVNMVYQRADGTLSSFFSREQLESMAKGVGFWCKECKYVCTNIINKKDGKNMRRVFIHGVFEKV
jgi:methyltransferase-like protein 6